MKTDARSISKSRAGLPGARRARPVAAQPAAAGEEWPEISPRALDTFAAELEADRAAGRLTSLGKSARAAAAALRQTK